MRVAQIQGFSALLCGDVFLSQTSIGTAKGDSLMVIQVVWILNHELNKLYNLPALNFV